MLPPPPLTVPLSDPPVLMLNWSLPEPPATLETPANPAVRLSMVPELAPLMFQVVPTFWPMSNVLLLPTTRWMLLNEPVGPPPTVYEPLPTPDSAMLTRLASGVELKSTRLAVPPPPATVPVSWPPANTNASFPAPPARLAIC